MALEIEFSYYEMRAMTSRVVITDRVAALIKDAGVNVLDPKALFEHLANETEHGGQRLLLAGAHCEESQVAYDSAWMEVTAEQAAEFAENMGEGQAVIILQAPSDEMHWKPDNEQ